MTVAASSVYSFSATLLDGTECDFSSFAGKVLLIVNTASRCGFTPQYAGLEALYKKYRDRGLVVVGFPCNQFGAQEPGTATEISEFCQMNYGVSFPIFSRIEVNGAGAHPLYKYLTSEVRGFLGTEAIKWNFTKFLVDRSGHPVQRFAPKTAPADLQEHIEKLL
jgi:glutathione peroxidase